MDFKRVYSPEDRKNKCKTILFYSYIDCIDYNTWKKPTVLWSTNSSNIKRLQILSAAGEFIYSLETKELRDVSAKIFEAKHLRLFFPLKRKTSELIRHSTQFPNVPTKSRQHY